MGRRKGQITVFIIIGIIALVSVGVYTYMRTIKVEAPITYRPTIEQVPVEAEPIREFVQSCVELTAENGLRVIGDFGGYISKEAMNAVVNPISPTQGDAVQFSPDSTLVVPFWWHMKGSPDCEKSGTCEFDSTRPGLYRTEGGLNIEEQLDEYVNENLKTCLRGFIDLQDQGFEISEAGPVETKTVVTQETVAFDVTYPLHARKAGVDYELNRYFVDIPLNLMEIYEYATVLVNVEAETNFLERYSNRILAYYQRLDEDAIPPVSGSASTSDQVIWMESEVKERVKHILVSYIPMMKVFGSGNWRMIDVPEGTPYRNARLAMFNNLMLAPLINESHVHPGLDVNFVYLDWWDIYFNLNCRGELCGPMRTDSALQALGSLFMRRYQFNYDFSFPVLVNIVNPRAFHGKGYSFKYFIEANVRDNRAVREMREGPALPPIPEAPTGTMVCDANKRTEHEFEIMIFDPFTIEGVPDAELVYNCGADTCEIGRTGPDGKITTSFPQCVGGILKITKPGYFSVGGVLNSVTPRLGAIDLQMYPMMERNFEVRKYKIRKIGEWTPTYASSLFSQKEEAVVTMTRHAEIGEEEFTAFVEYLGDRSLDDHSRNVSIVPGTYDIDITMVYRGDYTIPERRQCESIEYIEGIWEDEECFDLEAIEFTDGKPLTLGTTHIEDVVIHASDLESSDTVVLHAVVIDLPGLPMADRYHADMEQVMAIDDYAPLYGGLLNPKYETAVLATVRGVQQTTLE